MHGEIFDNDTPMGTHPNCRCTMLPYLGGKLNVTLGKDQFEKLSEKEQRRILGKEAFKEYKAGKVELSDFVKVTKHPQWGTTRSRRPLNDILGRVSSKQKGIESHNSFYEEKIQRQYVSKFKTFGQMNEDSCVAAVTKMILNDFHIDQPEAYISSALELKDGAYLSQMPEVLRVFGLNSKFKWRNDLNFDELKAAVGKGRAIVSVKPENSKYRHAIIVDDIVNDEVRIRDSLPLGKGKSYAISVDDFLRTWLRNNNVGGAVIHDD